ncbi:MAG: ATP-binding protein [Anaerolineae bacterium]|nr:ATP-binding protein [Anaerolineae bacterium]
MLHVKVRDTGIGMSEDDLKRLFHEDYFRSANVPSSVSGTGLGMMITQRIVLGHGGRDFTLANNEPDQRQRLVPRANLSRHMRLAHPL